MGAEGVAVPVARRPVAAHSDDTRPVPPHRLHSRPTIPNLPVPPHTEHGDKTTAPSGRMSSSASSQAVAVRATSEVKPGCRAVLNSDRALSPTATTWPVARSRTIHPATRLGREPQLMTVTAAIPGHGWHPNWRHLRCATSDAAGVRRAESPLLSHGCLSGPGQTGAEAFHPSAPDRSWLWLWCLSTRSDAAALGEPIADCQRGAFATTWSKNDVRTTSPVLLPHDLTA